MSGSSAARWLDSSRAAARVSSDSAAVGDPVTECTRPYAISSSAPASSVGGWSGSPGRASTACASSSAPVPINAGTASAASRPILAPRKR